MIGRLALLALIVASVSCFEQQIIDTLKGAGADKVAILGHDGFIRASDNYDLPRRTRAAILDAFTNPSEAVSNGILVYNKYITVEKADEHFIEGSSSGNKFIAFKTINVIVASVWPESVTNAADEVHKLIEFLANQHY